MSFRRSESASVAQLKKRSSKGFRAPRQLSVEPLEHRNLLTLLGVTPSFPTITYDSTGILAYNSTNHHFDVTASPLTFKASSPAAPQVITAPRSVTMNIQVDNAGNLLNDFATSDLTVTGTIVGSPGLSGTILTAKVIAVGYQFTGSGVDNYDIIAIPTGGTLFSMFAGQDVGMTIGSANSTFTGSFNSNFGGGAKGTIGSVPLFTGNISGNKFNDITGNGFSGDDTGLGGVTVNLFRDLDNSGTLTGGDGPAIATTTTTAGTGAYSFTNLVPGTYFVQETVPSGQVQTAGGVHTVHVTSGSNTTGQNFDDFKLINISGTKFNDLTGNGFTADDTPLGGVTINLYLNGGSTPVATTVTAANGTYSFTGLGPGSYFVQEAVPGGSTQTGGNAGYTISATSGSNSTGNNFSNFSNVAITGNKFNDLTGDGFSADDTPLAGVTINLFLNGGSTPIASTVTAGDGSYAFNNLGPGTYYVQETVPAGWTQTGGIGGYTIITTSGSGSSGNNFDDFHNITVSGTKYKDNTGNGITGDDTGLGGVTINLFLNGGSTPVASTVTAADGSYSFTNLGPGTYTVQEVVPAGSTQTAGNAGYTISANSGSNSSGNNFANFANISISGTKFNDITGNSFSADDTGLGGVTINLYLNGGSTPVASTVTAADGSYSFTNLGPGSYTVQEDVPAGSTQTGGNAGYTISATSGTNSSGNNFDNFANISISGTKFNDITGNSFSADDTGLGGVTINLYLNGGSTPVASTVTAADGSYSFTNLGPGSYTVQEVVPAGSTQTGGNAGYTISATSGTNSSGNNFDNFANINISGTKFNDITGNSFSADDTGLGGVTINLFLNGGSTPIASTVTAADGSYSFTNLGPGSYTVQEVVPAGSTQTGGNAGYTISATSGANSSGNNFDNFANISISGTKFNDITGNSFSGDDVGQGGVTINLYLNGGSTPVASTVTAADGSYSFTNLGPGSYTVQEVVPAGSTQTGGNAGYTISATSGANSSGNNFDNFANISISGTKFNDITGNSFSGDDVGQGGVTINLYLNGGSTPVASTVTAADGSYSFTNLGPGSYTVQEVVPAGSTQTGGNAGYTISATSGTNSSGNNFDNFANINISGTKFNDITGNSFSGDDVGQGGVTVNLYLNGGSTPVASTVTAADGSYSFTNLGPGSYSVQEVVPAGSTQTGGNAGYTISATSGTNSSGNNFDNFANINISGTKFNDITGNSFSGDDVGQGGVTINLYKNGGSTPVASTVTAANGSYSFTNLGPGSYTVQEVVPAGSTQTGGNAGYTISATSGTNSSGNNFDNFANISISGTKYKDNTGNGITGDDTGLGGVTINLFLNGGSTPVASTVTAADGSYSFTNLGPGSYTVQEVVPAGSTQTAGNAGYTISATSGTNSSGNNFANFQTISISGTKFNDITGNSFSGDDVGQGGVTINLYLNGGSTPVASTVTTANGSYSFTNLGPGSYTVQEVTPAGSTQTGGNAGYTIVATSGTNSTGNNFDNFANINISGTKFNDITGNSFSGDDVGQGGVTVNLYLNGGSTPVASTVTAANGSYSFTNLGPGSYTVQEVVPAGSTQTGGNAGYTISATSGTNSSGNNFDNFANISISGTKFNDITGNGFSGDDVGQGGVTVNLYKNGGSTPVASTVTAADGSYSFTNLGPGSYTVQEVVPAGSTQTGGNAGYTISATSGTNSSGNNFDNFANISISGTKFNDITGNSFSGDDVGQGGVTVNLYLNGGSTPVASTVTAANGSYSFTNLGPGSYTVQEVVPAGSTQTGGNAGYTISATSGTNSSGNNFDNFANINISGTKFNDITGNGFSGDDVGQGGVTVNLYKNGGSTPVASAVTAADGSYSFTNLGPGSYTVQEVVPAGSTQTGGNAGYTISATSGTNSSGNNFDNFANINISGTKYTDITGNGVTGDDTGLGGVTINLYKNGGSTPVASTVTAANGSYSFTNLGPGSYSVQEVVPAGWTQTAGNSGYSVSATSGSNSSGNNFADFQNISISGTKFNDITGNSFSADDTPLGGVTINLYRNGGSTPVATTVTAANGTYSFGNLGPGTYSVQEQVPAGSVQTGGIGGYTVVATSGTNATGKNFDDYFSTSTISGTKYNDITGNSFSADDTGLGGVTINLYKNGGSTPIATTVTAANGSFSFTNLGPGTYSVQEVVPAGSTQTGGIGGYTFVLTSGQNSSGNNFDDFQNICISGTKYNDCYGDGINSGDTGLGGVTINLYKNGGSTPVASTVTAANGTYSFTNLGPGTYTVQEVVPAGWTQTAGNGGYSISATSGGNYTGKNFADFDNINISGTKYNDCYGDGINSGDTGLGGVTINLYKNGGSTPVASTVTAANGSYSFTNLGPGTYSVQEVVPSGWTQTAGIGGYSISASSGNDASGKNFADFDNISISGKKYNDLTGNCITSDDVGLGGVTIQLFKNGGTTPVASTVTAADGTYSFTNLGPGTYTVKELVPAGSVQTVGMGGYTINASSGNDVSGKNFADFFTSASIKGTKFLDVTGNGLTADDTGMGGVTIKLFKDMNGDNTLTTADGAAVASTTTASNGTYAFSNLSPGTYFVQEVTPTGYVRTAPTNSDTYIVHVTSGSTSTGLNFANAAMCDCDGTDVTNISYLINGTTVVTDLRGNTNQGDLVQVTFTLTTTETLSLVSYTAPGATFDANTASQQQIFDVDSGTFGPGTYTLTVHIPNSFYQVDFVCGQAIDHLGPAGSNIFYSAQCRLFSADNDGCTAVLANGSSIAGNVYADTANYGVFDASEKGISYTQVKLTGTTTAGVAVSITAYTAPDGSYIFNNLATGTYKITETDPVGYGDGADTAGTAGGSVSNDVISNIVIGANVHAVNYNFGEKPDVATSTAASSSSAAISAVSYQTDVLNSGYSMLVIGGTTAADTITVTCNTSGRYTVTINGSSATFNNTDTAGHSVDLIVIYGFGGYNTITVNSSITTATAIFGGNDGNKITGGSGYNVIVGGTAADNLIGGSNRDLLIGGGGADTLAGNGGDDIIVAGTTSYNSNLGALESVMAEWTSSHSYADRVANIKNGTSSVARLNGAFFFIDGWTVFDDSSKDTLSGGSGTDLFFANVDAGTLDVITDLSTGETVVDLG